MPTGTYIALANTTLTATDTEVTFSSIPQTYRDLAIAIDGTFSGTDVRIRINGLTTSIYNWVYAQGTGGVGTSEAIGPTNLGIGWGGLTSGNRITALLNFMDYSTTDKHKTVLIRNSEFNEAVIMTSGRIATTDAITSITFRIQNAGGSYQIGSNFTLYGIAS